MPNIARDIALRSEEVQEILGSVPHWMIRWGITIIFLLLASVVGLMYLIEYPDVVTGELTLTTENPPIKIVVQADGKLTHLLVKEGDMIKKGEPLGEIENPITQEGITWLKKITATIERLLKEEKSSLSFHGDHAYVFGNIQSAYNELKNNCLDYQQLLSDPYNPQKISHLKAQILNYERMGLIAKQQLFLLEKEIKNEAEKYEANRKLYQEKVIPKLEFLDKENFYHQKQHAYESFKRGMVQDQIALSNLKENLLDLTHGNDENKRRLKETINIRLAEIKNLTDSWQASYLLVSPIDGTVSYSTQVAENQFFRVGDSPFTIVPNEVALVGYIYIVSTGFGKVKSGQKVRIKFDYYPYQEYGQIMGRVESMALLPNENKYRIAVRLENGLNTTFRKKLAFKPEMGGTAEIITENRRLIDRIFYQFRILLNHAEK